MSKQDEKFAESWELLTDSERAELMRSEAADWQESEKHSSVFSETKSQRDDCVGNLTCFAINIASGFTGFVFGWWLS